jgi:phosphoglycerate dehydrogenase-like enzyme
MLGPECDAAVREATGVTVIPLGTDLAPAMAGADVLWIWPKGALHKKNNAPKPEGWPGRLKWAQYIGTGVDVCSRWVFDDIPVTCTRGLLAGPIAEHCLAAIFTFNRRWDDIRVRERAAWKWHLVTPVAGQTVGIIGLGAIGEQLAWRARGVGLRVLGMKRTPGPGPEGVEIVTLDQMLAQADHVVAAMPSTPQTRNMLDAAFFAKMKRGAHVINVARGDVLDQAALLAALDSGQVGYATLDVTAPEPLPDAHPLYTHPNVRISPHMAGHISDDNLRFAPHFIANLKRFMAGQPVRDVIDLERGY